jgi:predicted RNase H-like HicB family nuclease
MRSYVTRIMVEEVEGGYFSAYSPDAIGCVATGQTVQEAVENLRFALKRHFKVSWQKAPKAADKKVQSQARSPENDGPVVAVIRWPQKALSNGAFGDIPSNASQILDDRDRPDIHKQPTGH